MSNQTDLGVFHIDISNMKLIIDLKKIADVINVAVKTEMEKQAREQITQSTQIENLD